VTTSQRATTAHRRLQVVQDGDPAALRAGQIELYRKTLLASTSKRGYPYDAQTIRTYLQAPEAWDAWLTKTDFQGTFKDVTILEVNGFLADYLRTHTLGGTVTKQGNLQGFLAFLVDEYQIENLWDHKKRNKYQRRPGRAPVLAEEVIEAMLQVTKGRSFRDRRDHAIIRMLLNGPRRIEVATMDVDSLDLTSVVRTVFLKGVKDHPGRRIGMGNKDVLALERYLRVREQHPQVIRQKYPNADGNPLWIANKDGRRLQPDGIYYVLRTRAVQAGFDQSLVYTHLFRHTAAHEFLDAGGTDSNAMAHFGWRDRSMLDHYGSGQAENRAIKAVVTSGFGDRH
jgi:site-specific recombinase XerD